MDATRVITRISAAFAIALAALAALAAGGGTSNDPQGTYSNGWKGRPEHGVTASVTLQFVSYELNSVAGKYKLIPVLLRTDARPGPLPLSLEQDRLVVASGGKTIAASFQLSALDRTLWDSLSPDTRKFLTYPEQVNANSAIVVYAFVPLAELTGRPERFEYTIKSLPAPLILEQEEKKKAALSFGPLSG